MPDVMDWRRDVAADAVMARVLQTFAQGGLVGLPTECGYAVAGSALCADVVGKLAARGPLVLAVRDAQQAMAWLDVPSPLASRLMRRCWPGPVQLAFDASQVKLERLPEATRATLTVDGAITLRCPGHGVFLETLYTSAEPLVFISTDAATAEQLIASAGAEVEIVIDDGPTRYGKPTTAVRLRGNHWDLLREGIVSVEQLEALSCCFILFVCTGNTCRSPLAEALCKKLLAEKLGCQPDELPRHGYLVQSAGLAAFPGGPATEEAVVIAQQFGADLAGHASQPVTPSLVSQADHVVTMTRGHLRLLTEVFPQLPATPRLLCGDGDDIPDPIGSSQEVYRSCAEQILKHLERFVPEVQA